MSALADYTCYNVIPTDRSVGDVNNDPHYATKLVFTLGKMNPPTTGHRKLITHMLEYSLAHGDIPVFICLTNTTVDCEEYKRELIDLMINSIKKTNKHLININVKVICFETNMNKNTTKIIINTSRINQKQLFF